MWNYYLWLCYWKVKSELGVGRSENSWTTRLGGTTSNVKESTTKLKIPHLRIYYSHRSNKRGYSSTLRYCLVLGYATQHHTAHSTVLHCVKRSCVNLYCAVLRFGLFCCALLCYTVMCRSVLCYVALCCVLRYIALRCVVFCCIVLCCVVQCCVVMCWAVLGCAVLECTALYCAVLCFASLCCIVLYSARLCRVVQWNTVLWAPLGGAVPCNLCCVTRSPDTEKLSVYPRRLFSYVSNATTYLMNWNCSPSFSYLC